jgi:hypothetical protein
MAQALRFLSSFFWNSWLNNAVGSQMNNYNIIDALMEICKKWHSCDSIAQIKYESRFHQIEVLASPYLEGSI